MSLRLYLLRHGETSVVKLDQHGPLLEILGDRAHLDENLRTRSGT